MPLFNLYVHPNCFIIAQVATYRKSISFLVKLVDSTFASEERYVYRKPIHPIPALQRIAMYRIHPFNELMNQ